MSSPSRCSVRMSVACGRGPTSDIVPCSTLNSCGSSSRLLARRKRPTRVMRLSARAVCCSPVVAAAGFQVMVRNLKMSNTRLSSAWRRWRKITGPGLSSRTASAMTASTGSSASVIRLPSSRSSAPLSTASQRPIGRSTRRSTGTLPPIASMARGGPSGPARSGHSPMGTARAASRNAIASSRNGGACGIVSTIQSMRRVDGQFDELRQRAGQAGLARRGAAQPVVEQAEHLDAPGAGSAQRLHELLRLRPGADHGDALRQVPLALQPAHVAAHDEPREAGGQQRRRPATARSAWAGSPPASRCTPPRRAAPPRRARNAACGRAAGLACGRCARPCRSPCRTA